LRKIGGVILALGCVVAYYYLVEFDTTVVVRLDFDRSRRVPDVGRMHQQTVWTIAGITAAVVGLAVTIVGQILCVTTRRADHG
jgi:hypothetical protein